jgi:Protein of unknown function (DUF2808)
MNYFLSALVSASLVAPIGILALPRSASAVRLADGTIYFARSPQLGTVSTTASATNAWVVTYYFTLMLPANAGEPLGQVTIAQSEGFDAVRFSPREITAFAGTNRRSGEKFNLETAVDRKAKTVTVKFDPPVPPGQTVTIALSPERNPFTGGVYLFGVTAFPAGSKAHGQFLGFGRLHFYDGHDALLPLVPNLQIGNALRQLQLPANQEAGAAWQG